MNGCKERWEGWVSARGGSTEWRVQGMVARSGECKGWRKGVVSARGGSKEGHVQGVVERTRCKGW